MPFTPIWFMIISPVSWLFLLPSLLLLVGVVLFFLFRVFKLDDFKTFFRKSFLKVLLCTFISYFASTVFLFFSQAAFNDWWYEFLTSPVAFNPFDNVFALLFTVICIAAGGAVAYFLNFKYALRTAISTEKMRRMFALCAAILTVPLLYLTPSRLLFDEPGTRLHNFTNHIVWVTNDTLKITDADGTERHLKLPLTEEENAADPTVAEDYWTVADAVNHAAFTRNPVAGETLYTLDFYAVNQPGRPVTITVQDNGAGQLIFVCSAGVFNVLPEEQEALLAVLEG